MRVSCRRSAVVKTADQRWQQVWRAVLLAAALFLFFFRSATALEVVAHRDVPVTQLSRTELQAIFTMRVRTWSDGSTMRVFVLGDNTPEQSEFAKKLLDIFPYQLRRYWDRLVFSGTGQAPIELTSSGEMYNRIASTPGAIGYLPSEHIGTQVRVIKVGTP